MKYEKKFAARETSRILVFGLVCLVLVGAVIWKESRPEYEKYQQVFIEILPDYMDPSLDLKDVSIGVQQIYLPRAGRVDRCQTCHLGIVWKGLETAPLPYQTHPDPSLTWIHPVERFGCTLCHEGQGYALTKAEAHGFVPRQYWSKPILPKEYLQASCGKCHNPDLMENDAPKLFAGKRLYLEKGCIDCHKIGQIGGTIAPDQSNLARFSIRYLLESVLDPKANDPDSVMPDLGFTEDRAKTLLVYLLSLDETYIPHEYKTVLQQ
jgi:cytochrome c553